MQTSMLVFDSGDCYVTGFAVNKLNRFCGRYYFHISTLSPSRNSNMEKIILQRSIHFFHQEYISYICNISFAHRKIYIGHTSLNIKFMRDKKNFSKLIYACKKSARKKVRTVN